MGAQVEKQKAPRRKRAALWRMPVALTLQLAGGAAVLAGVYLLVGLAVALVVGGVAALALGILHEAGWL